MSRAWSRFKHIQTHGRSGRFDWSEDLDRRVFGRGHRPPGDCRRGLRAGWTGSCMVLASSGLCAQFLKLPLLGTIDIAVRQPVVLHEVLNTTFTGIVHPVSTHDEPVHQYRGIKYASITTRFRQSRLHTSYPSYTDATRLGPICPQLRRKGVEEELFGLSEDCIPKQNLKQSEFECLNLNITCPGTATPESMFPVMLWIHGGNNRGSGSSWIYDGGALVQKSMRLPLGLLGFAASPALRDDNWAAGDNGVGNYGLRDQQRAIEWVHHFISDFGGDPSNITLFGESTGAADILCHLHSAENETRPLFRRVILQSVNGEIEVPNWHSTGSQLSRIMSTLHVHTVEELRAVEPEKLVALGSHVRATNDGVFFRKGFTGSLVEEQQEHLHHHHTEEPHELATPPIMIGDCSDEALLWSLPASLWTSSGVVRRVRAICQSLSKANARAATHLLELINDARFAWPTDRIAASVRRALGGRGVWRYTFGPCYEDEDEDGSGSGSEFGTDSGYADDWAMPVVDDWTYARVRNAVQERWIAFAHGEAPWQEEKGEVGERSWSIFHGRRRTQAWKDALEPLGCSSLFNQPLV
ncbi:carboxylesterase [Amylocystis lapponica]|nr:carboxylesterase [Amylocystis lapponica]